MNLDKLILNRLSVVKDEVQEEIERKPTISEFFEVIVWTIKNSNSKFFHKENPWNLIGVEITVNELDKKIKLNINEPVSQVMDFSDSVFVLASDVIAKILSELNKKTKEVTIELLFKSIESAINSINAGLFDDVDGKDILKIKTILKSQKHILCSPGDLIAIPVKNHYFCLLVVITKNVFGTAFGAFDLITKTIPVKLDSTQVLKYPIYSSDEFISEGKWKIILNDKNLLTLFPSDPEIFHSPNSPIYDPSYGPFGLGETSVGKLRRLTESEANELGLLSDDYLQGFLPEELEEFLRKRYTSE